MAPLSSPAPIFDPLEQLVPIECHGQPEGADCEMKRAAGVFSVSERPDPEGGEYHAEDGRQDAKHERSQGAQSSFATRLSRPSQTFRLTGA